jgi:hypothetical protein
VTTASILQLEIAKIGYSAIVEDYVFSDVFAKTPTDRKASIAAFTHTPPSYRNAAFAVAHQDHRSAAEIVSDYRALGAPLVFVIEGSNVAVWQTGLGQSLREVARASVEELSDLFFSHRDDWSPQSIQRAKSIGQYNPQYQLDFVDLGLLPAIEGEIHGKLDLLLNESLAEAINPETGRPRGVTSRSLFLAVFRFLTAKVLQDRSHPVASAWNPERIETVLNTISQYYKLPALTFAQGSNEHRVFASVWQRLRQGINFQNISADDLAFVYENTLVTPDIRKALGTHSTPRQVAEYIVCHLGFHEYANQPEALRVYEPFAGAAVLLTSALRHLRELLPVSWTDQQRHDFLIRQMAGDEIDAFACEVATLSLILADYPSHNGWHIRERNLFEEGALERQMRKHNIILCNPPFESFSQDDRAAYPLARQYPSKAMAVLNTALEAHPLAMGFVLPRTFILEKQFLLQRRRLEKLYGSVEIVELPDRIFKISKVESALLIAREPRPPASSQIKIRSTNVADRDGQRFLRTGEVTASRVLVRPIDIDPSGNLWIPPLSKLWSYLKDYPLLGERLKPSWGLQWKYSQAAASSDEQREGFLKGIHNADQIHQFVGRSSWLDYRKRHIRRGFGQEWDAPKIIINAARLSRGPWRVGAITDFRGLLYSQQFYGLWPTAPIGKFELLALSAILNGPLANAFIAAHSPANRFRASAVRRIPIPVDVTADIGELVADYIGRLNRPKLFEESELLSVLYRIDAAVLKAYDLPPRLERELLDYFKGFQRPIVHPWKHWLPDQFEPFVPLHEYFSGAYQRAIQPWVRDVFQPLPPDEADAFSEYMD